MEVSRARVGLHVLLVLMATACPAPELDEMVANQAWTLARERGRHVEVNGLRIFALTLGSGPDVLLLHGNPDSMRAWKHVVEPLAEHFRVHAIDLPGFGMSEKPDVAYEDAWLAEHVVGYLEAAGVSSATLVGNSMGDTIATETAMLFPDRVGEVLAFGDLSFRNRPSAQILALPEGSAWVDQQHLQPTHGGSIEKQACAPRGHESKA